MTNKMILAAVLALLASAPTAAQDTPAGFDSRWTPYLGCWTIVQNQRGHAATVPPGTMVCVRPSGRFGVAITTTVDGKNVLEQTIVADGSAQPISQGDCKGTQTSDWSRDGERLFTRVELECANRPKRAVSGLTLLADGHWVDAQATVIDGNSDVRLRRYRRSSDQYAAVPAATGAPLSIEDVIEASAKVQSEALEAALDELNSRFTLSSRVLTQLADNGVSPNVIDLMVAQAYPERFEVERSYYPTPSSASTSYGTSVGSTSVYMGSTYPYPMYDPFYSSYYYYSPFAYPYYWGPGYSYRYRYGYSPFYRDYYNYNYFGFGGGGYYGGPSGSSGGNAQPGSPDSRGGDGIATGRGYTRVRPTGSSNSGAGTGEASTPTSRTSGSMRGVRSSGDSGSSSSSPSSSSSGSSGASSGGYSSGGGDSGGGGGGGGRTAQPR